MEHDLFSKIGFHFFGIMLSEIFFLDSREMFDASYASASLFFYLGSALTSSRARDPNYRPTVIPGFNFNNTKWKLNDCFGMEEAMWRYLLLPSGAAAIFAIAIASIAHSQDLRAPEGRGLLPAPTEATLAGPTPPHAFSPDQSGELSRIIFETTDSPDFNLVIQDFAFAPGSQHHTITLPSAAFLHLLSGNGEVRIANQQTVLTPLVRTTVPAGAAIDIVNTNDYPLVIRALIVEAK